MIDYDNEFYSMDMECDECGNNDTFDGPWQECIEEAKENEWIIFDRWIIFEDDDGDWVHYCSMECRNKAKM